MDSESVAPEGQTPNIPLAAGFPSGWGEIFDCRVDEMLGINFGIISLRFEMCKTLENMAVFPEEIHIYIQISDVLQQVQRITSGTRTTVQ
jgi:hypothetical protein